MYCSKCSRLEDKVIDSRLSKDGRSIRRRRECLQCGQRFTTYEEVERSELRVAKRDGRSEPFDKEKLLAGMIKACEKRPVGVEALEKVAEEITHNLHMEFRREVPSHVIGAKVMVCTILSIVKVTTLLSDADGATPPGLLTVTVTVERDGLISEIEWRDRP